MIDANVTALILAWVDAIGGTDIQAGDSTRFGRSAAQDENRVSTASKTISTCSASRERRLVLDGIQRRLRHEPTRPTKHVKRLRKLFPPFEYVPPIWQLPIGEHRIFYDVDEVEKVVSVRAVRRKPPHMTTEQIP